MSPARYLDRHQADLVAFLQKLIRLRTVNPPGENYGKISTLLADTLRRLDLQVRRVPVSRALQKITQPGLLAYPRYNVIGFWDTGSKKTLHFNAHYDVVPVSGAWRHGSAFNPVVENGWIYGRGTADMKGSIASLLMALDSLRATRTAPRLNVEVSFTADEETDSVLGTGWLVAHAPIRPDYAIVMEGGERHRVCCGHNGTLWLEVTVHGRAAHGSTPEKGVNALEKMSALVLALGDCQRRLARRTFVTPEGKTMRPTINVGGVFAPGPGGKINTVPALATFTLDRRVLAIEDPVAAERDLRAFLAAAARKIPGCRITVAKISENFSCFSPPTHPFFAAMAGCVTRVRQQKAVFNVSTGFNDMHFFSHHLKIPTLGYGPGGENEHAIDERAQVKELLASAKIYAELLTTFTG